MNTPQCGMSFFDSINIAATGLTAERTQMDVTSENLANAQSTNNGNPYKPQTVELQTVGSELPERSSPQRSARPATPGGVEVTGIVSENVAPSSSTTPATRRPTSRATSRSRTSSRSPR